MWSIHQSVIAQRISEKDFQNLSNLSGIVIQPGTSAVIYINGKEAAKLDSGEYIFADNEEVNRILDKTIVNYQSFSGNNSIPGFIKSGWSKIVRFLTGHKVGEKQEEINDSHRSVDEVVRHLYNSSGDNISIYLKVNSPFPTFFGYDPYKEGSEALVPMKIRTRVLDAEVTVVILMQITDFQKFLSYYMTYRNCVSIMDIQKETERYISNLVQEELRNEDIDENGISQDAKARITVRLKEIERYMYGISIIDVPEISSDSKVFDRFRQIASEIFCSEKELDYLQRSNELKNRLAAINLSQDRSELETQKALDEVNKDRLLHEDEMERFKKSLEIKSQDDQAEMMAESAAKKIAINAAIQKKQLLAEHDIEELKNDILFNDGKTSLQRQLELDDMLRRHGYTKDQEDALNTSTVVDIELGTRKKIDDYERGKHKADVLDEVEEVKMWQDVALNAKARHQELEEREREQEHRRKMDELAMQQRAALAEQQAKNDALRIYSTMGADAITATGIATGVKFDEHSAAAAAAIAGGHHEAEALKTILKMREDDHQAALAERERSESRHMDDIRFVLDKALGNREQVHQAQVQNLQEKVQDIKDIKDEYHDELRHQQSRIDHTQDSALQYTSKVSIAEDTRPARTLLCPICRKPLPEGATECNNCHTSFVQK